MGLAVDVGGSRGGSAQAEVVRIARAAIRRHSASPLTGTPPFWERLVREVLSAEAGLREAGNAHPSIPDVARAAAPALSGSPIVNSDALWRAIVGTVLGERAPA